MNTSKAFQQIVLLLVLIIFPTENFGQGINSNSKISLKKIGELKPRNSREIESSNWSIGCETIDRHFSVYANWKEYLGPLGAKKARIQSGWARTETEKGKYNWEWLDEIIPDMVAQGVEPWMQTSYGNTIYEGGGGINLGDGLPESEESLAAWKNFVVALVNRYKNYIDEWEVWNEPNYRIDYEKYADFLILTAGTIKSVQPDAKILAFALGSGVNYEFADKVLKIIYDKGKINLIDQVTHHRNIAIPEDNKNEVELDKVIRRYSGKIISRQGEAGCPGTYCENFALSKMPWNELQQAKSNIRRMMLDLGRGKESSVFTIIDLKYVMNNKVVMNTKGLIEADEEMKVKRLKPNYFAVQNVCSLFDNSLVRDNEMQSGIKGENIYHFEYKNKLNQKNLIVFWEGGEIPKPENQYKRTDIKITGASISKPVLVDLRTGEVFAIPKIDFVSKRNEMYFKNLFLYDSPVVLTDLSMIRFKDVVKTPGPIPKTEIGFREIDKIKPVKAAGIKASYLGIGCEVLDRDYACYDCYKEYLGNLGVKHARFQSGWAKTEKMKGVYDFAWFDPIIDDCISRGIQPWIDIGYGNPIYPGGGGILLGNDMPHGEIALKAWDAFVYNLVTHFKSRIFEWEIWNEANNLRGINAGPEIYADLFIRTAEIIRQNQPEGKIIALAIGYYAIDYVRDFFDYLKSKGKLHLVDVVSLHGYPSNPDDGFDRTEKLINLVKQYNDKITFLQGESGSPSTKGSSGAMANVDFSELIQAKWNLRRALAHIGRGIPHSQFAISDMKYPRGMNTKGLLKANDDISIAYPKQSYFAYQNLTSLFDSSVVASREVNCEIEADSASSLYTFLIKKSNKPVITYWYSGRVPDSKVETQKAVLKITGVKLNSPVLVDIRTGLVYKIPKSAIKTDNYVLELKIPIYDAPLLICEKAFLKKAKSPATDLTAKK